MSYGLEAERFRSGTRWSEIWELFGRRRPAMTGSPAGAKPRFVPFSGSVLPSRHGSTTRVNRLALLNRIKQMDISKNRLFSRGVPPLVVSRPSAGLVTGRVFLIFCGGAAFQRCLPVEHMLQRRAHG